MLDYVGIAQGRLTNQFYDRPIIKALAGAMVAPLANLELVADQLKSERWISSAIGKQLDGVGYIVREDRKGRNDDDYRRAILFRIFINTSTATPEELIYALRYLTEPSDIQYIEQYPACAELFTDGPAASQAIQALIQSLAPAAIETVPVMVTFAHAPPLRFALESVPSELFVNMDADYLTGNDADIQIQLTTAVSGPSLGGATAADFFVGDFLLDVGDPTLAINTPEYQTVIESGYHMTGLFR